MVTTVDLALPRFRTPRSWSRRRTSVPGNWAGGASAVLHEGVFWLTYRLRRPIMAGRGVSVVVARSDDGVSFETVCELHRDLFGADSFERPVLVPLSDRRLAALRQLRHPWIEALVDRGRRRGFTRGARLGSRGRSCFPVTTTTAVKDPVIMVDADGRWQMWVCCHPLDVPGAEDRMWTAYATSADGLVWVVERDVLRPTPGHLGRARSTGDGRAAARPADGPLRRARRRRRPTGTRRRGWRWSSTASCARIGDGPVARLSRGRRCLPLRQRGPASRRNARGSTSRRRGPTARMT